MEKLTLLVAVANAVSALAIAYVAVRTFYRKRNGNGSENGGFSRVS